MEFKDRIKLLRQERNLSLAQLAGSFNKSESAIRTWEAGRTKPDADTLIELSRYFDCTTDYLLGLSDFRNVEAQSRHNEDLEKISLDISTLPEDGQKLLFAVFSQISSLSKLFYNTRNADDLMYVFFSRLPAALMLTRPMLDLLVHQSKLEKPKRYSPESALELIDTIDSLTFSAQGMIISIFMEINMIIDENISFDNAAVLKLKNERMQVSPAEYFMSKNKIPNLTKIGENDD